jgi:hypothetical protein
MLHKLEILFRKNPGVVCIISSVIKIFVSGWGGGGG